MLAPVLQTPQLPQRLFVRLQVGVRHRAEGPALTINPEERPPTSEELLSKIRPPTNFVCGVEEPYQLN